MLLDANAVVTPLRKAALYEPRIDQKQGHGQRSLKFAGGGGWSLPLEAVHVPHPRESP